MTKKGAYFRGLLGVVLAAGAFLLNDETVRGLIPQWAKIAGGAILAGLGALRLWLDQSLSLSESPAADASSVEKEQEAA